MAKEVHYTVQRQKKVVYGYLYEVFADDENGADEFKEKAEEYQAVPGSYIDVASKSVGYLLMNDGTWEEHEPIGINGWGSGGNLPPESGPVYVTIPSASGHLDARTYAILSDPAKHVVAIYGNNHLNRIQIAPKYVRFAMTRNRNTNQDNTVTLIAYDDSDSRNYEYSIIDNTYYIIKTVGTGLTFDANDISLSSSAQSSLGKAETAVQTSQGVAHAGEFLVVGDDGNVTTRAFSAWEGGSY